MLGDLLDLQWHEAVVDGGDIVIAGVAPEHQAITLGNLRLIAQGADMVPLAHAHGAAGFLQRYGHAELGKGFDEDLGRRERAEVDHSTRPVQDDRLQAFRVLILHGDSPVFRDESARTLQARRCRWARVERA
ncbi:hypothetical protein D3C80_1364690 [compost metagenome]